MEWAKDSAVWRYFTLATAASSTASCNVCKGNVARVGGSTAKYKTTNLFKHLQMHHAKEHATTSWSSGVCRFYCPLIEVWLLCFECLTMLVILLIYSQFQPLYFILDFGFLFALKVYKEVWLLFILNAVLGRCLCTIMNCIINKQSSTVHLYLC